MRILVVLVACAALAAPGAASAATVTAVLPGITVTAAPGERNDVTIRRDGQAVVLRDAGAPLTSRDAACTAVDPHTVRCTSAGLPWSRVLVVLGDGDDRASASGPPGFYVQIAGGAGADVLTGTDGPDALAGGPGSDELHGGAGRDTLVDDGAGPEPDVFDGGPGHDGLSYDGRRDALRIDLGTASVPGDGDRLVDLEAAAGGAGDDTLIAAPGAGSQLAGGGGDDTLMGGPGNDGLDGGDGQDQLLGGEGDDRAVGGPGDDSLAGLGGRDELRGDDGEDRVNGGAGDDWLVGGAGNDDLAGGPGDDRLELVDVAGDAAGCGAGTDHAQGTRGDLLDEDCERREVRALPTVVDRGRSPLRAVVHAGDGRARLRLQCANGPAARTCRGRVELRVGGRRAGARSFACARRSCVDVVVRVPAGRVVRRVAAEVVVTFAGGLPVRERVWLAP